MWHSPFSFFSHSIFLWAKPAESAERLQQGGKGLGRGLEEGACGCAGVGWAQVSTHSSPAACTWHATATAGNAHLLLLLLLLLQVERDGADVVGLGLSMWVLLLVFVLVSGFIGWATWVFLILAGLLLFFLNMVLLTSLRHMTMGGRVLRQQEVRVGVCGCFFWWGVSLTHSVPAYTNPSRHCAFKHWQY